MIDFTDIKQLNAELEDAIVNLAGYHTQMNEYKNYYKYSAFYKKRAGDPPTRQELKDNLLRVFADKNIHFTSGFPTIKVPGTPEDREAANIREKILLAVHRKSGTSLLQKKWARDATIRSIAISEVGFDLNKREAFVRRYDPRYVFYQISNGNDPRVIAFWAVYPMTKAEAKRRFGVEPKYDYLNHSLLGDPYLKDRIDGQEWFTHAIRWDENTRTAWVGDKLVEEPHNHMMDCIPVDICAPFDDDDKNHMGSFYLEPLVSLQAQLNDVMRKQAKIVDRMAEPVIWGRGVLRAQVDDVKQGLQGAGSGFVGLQQTGELGVLQVQESKMIETHRNQIIQDMMRISGFGQATFGEPTGANTSGDALGMYFAPTQKLIDDQNIAWVAFYESINAKILKMYDKFLKTGERVSLTGYAPTSTLLSVAGEERKYRSGAFTVEFDKSVIAGNYTNVVIPKPVTPKNEIEEKRLIKEAVDSKFLSRHTGYELWGLQSPQDEDDLIEQEQANPLLNPDGAAKLLQAGGNMLPPDELADPNAAELPAPTSLNMGV